MTESLFSMLVSETPYTPGVYHLVNEGSASRKELVDEIQSFLELKTEMVSVKTFDLPAPRPISSILRNTKLPPLPTWQDGLHRLLAKEKRKLDEKRGVDAKKQNAKDKYRAQQDALREEREKNMNTSD